MERLTIKTGTVNGYYTMKRMCTIGQGGIVDDESSCYEICNNNCDNCIIQEGFDRLAAYENTGYTPEEVEALKADNDRLHRLIDELESGLRKENKNA